MISERRVHLSPRPLTSSRIRVKVRVQVEVKVQVEVFFGIKE
jgi:hypothetical protein